LAFVSILKMEAICSTETPISLWPVQLYNPEYCTFIVTAARKSNPASWTHHHHHHHHHPSL
jgi:hypothetical protein